MISFLNTTTSRIWTLQNWSLKLKNFKLKEERNTKNCKRKFPQRIRSRWMKLLRKFKGRWIKFSLLISKWLILQSFFKIYQMLLALVLQLKVGFSLKILSNALGIVSMSLSLILLSWQQQMPGYMWQSLLSKSLLFLIIYEEEVH